MINLILGENGSGKTTYLNKEYNNLNDEWTKILFPTASEISSLINDKAAENCKGATGTPKKPTNQNPLNELILKLFPTISHQELDDKINEWECKNKELIWSSLNLKTDDCDDKFKSFCSVIEGNIKNQIKVSWPDNAKILSHFDDFKSYSHGQLSYYFMWLCFNIILSNKERLSKTAIFLDEPDNYLHPRFISKFIEKIVEINNLNDICIYITSHNYFFISELLNNPKLDDETKIKIFKMDNEKPKIMINNIKDAKNCCATRLLYDIYGIYTPDFLDYLIGESRLEFDGNGNADNNTVAQHPEFAIKDSSGNAKIIKNGNFSHHSYVNLIRNWYHHPKDRSNIEKDYLQKLNEKFNYDELLKKAIEQLIDWLTRNNKYKKIAFKEN